MIDGIVIHHLKKPRESYYSKQTRRDTYNPIASHKTTPEARRRFVNVADVR